MGATRIRKVQVRPGEDEGTYMIDYYAADPDPDEPTVQSIGPINEGSGPSVDIEDTLRDLWPDMSF